MNLINKRYEIVRFLGSGNYGLTYLVYDRKVKSEVALKISDINATSKKVVSQLIQQFYTLKSINNPFIIKPFVLEKIYNIDNNPFERDIWFYTMPYISDSKTIDLFLKDNIENPNNILILLSKLIYAINFLHQFDISHNDIQLQNILINKDNDPVLLDIFPARISKYQFYEDFKQLFSLISISLGKITEKIPAIIEDFIDYSFENQYDYESMRGWLYEYGKIYDQHTYFFKGSNITSISIFKLSEYFDNIKEKLSNNNIIVWEDKDSLDSVKDSFHAYLKVKYLDVVYLKNVQDFYEYLSFKSGQNIENIGDAQTYLKSIFFQEKLYIIFDDYLHFPNKEKQLLLTLSREDKNKLILIRIENTENENDPNWIYHYLYIDKEKVLDALKLVFNWYEIDFSKFNFDFSVSTLFNFILFAKQNLNYFKLVNNKIFLQNTIINTIKKKFYDFISNKYGLNTLDEEEKKACIIFLSFVKPIPVNLLSSIEFYSVKKTVYLNLLNKKILRYYKNIDSLGIYEKILKEILEKKLKREYKDFYIKFQNYLYENFGLTIEDKRNYIKNLKFIKSKKLTNEVLLFYKNFSIFTYYSNYNEIYDLIFLISPEENLDLFCSAFLDYFYYALASLDVKKLSKMKEKLKTIKLCPVEKKEFKKIFEISISLVIAGISYDFEYIDNNITEFEKYIEDPFFAVILFYTYSNLLGWEQEGKKAYENVVKFLDKYSNIDYLFILYGLAAIYKYESNADIQVLENYFKIMNVVYNDSKEEKNWIFYLKAAHNIAVYYSSLEGEENKDKAIQYTKESILYNEQFKIYPTLIISYSNLVIDYVHKHRNHPEALFFLKKLENIADEAFLKDAIEEEQYFFAMIKATAYYIENWELTNAKKNIKKIESNVTNLSKYPLYFEYLAYKGIYLLRTGKFSESIKILDLMDELLNNKLYADNTNFYFSLGFDIFLFCNDYQILKKLEDRLLNFDKPKIENIIIDHDINYLYSCIIFGKEIKKSFKQIIFKENFNFDKLERYKNFYSIYSFLENNSDKLPTNKLNTELANITSFSRYTGDLFYSFCDNFFAYIVSNEKEYLLNALLRCKAIYAKLSEKEKKIFKSTKVIKRFLEINNSFSFYLSHDKSFNSFIEKSSENINITFDIINKIFEKLKEIMEEDIEQMFKFLLKFLIHYGYCTYSAIYKVDETYSIKLVQSEEKLGYNRFSYDYFERCFKIFLTQSSPFIIKSISYDGLKPHIFVAIPILDYTSHFTRKDSSSVYKFDEYSYFLIFETQRLVNPYWSINGEFATFLENILSFFNNQYLLTQENMYDPLTKVLVRNNFLSKLKNALSKVKFGCLLFIDIDNFKSINDIYSHDFGDKVLSKVAYIIKNSVRKVDIVGRYGGEEFLVFIPLITQEDSKIIAERIRNNVANEKILPDQKVTVTIGLSYYPLDSIFSDILISKAEIANRYGKLTGKNRIVVYNNQISLDSYSKKSINGLIVRDPIKTSENTKIFLELLELASMNKEDFIFRLEKGFDLIQKTIQYDFFFVTYKNKILLSNNEELFEKFIESIDKLNPFGLFMINNSIFNYCLANSKDYYFCIGNFKNIPYLQEQNTLFQLYCDTFFLYREIN